MQLTGLWQNGNFLKLWSGQTISLVGSAVSFLAIPLTAEALGASPLQMSYLATAGTLPSLVLGLFAGAWVDRMRRRPILIWTDVGRGLLLLTVPAAALFGILQISYLYIVALIGGTLGLFFSVAYRSYLPLLITREELVEGNSKLEVSRSASEIFGPSLAGLLVQWFTAPIAILLDAVSFLVSAIFLQRIDAVEPQPKNRAGKGTIGREIWEGLRFVISEPRLRAIARTMATLGFFNAALESVSLLYMVRSIMLTPGLIGLIFSIGGAGFLLGAALSGRLTQRFGVGPILIGALLCTGVGDLLLPLVPNFTMTNFVLLCLGQVMFGIGLTVFSIGQVSLRQALTPDEMQGRMNSIMHVLTVGIVPLGAISGGLLGEVMGLRSALYVAVAGELSAVLWLWFSSVRRTYQLPQ